MPVSRRSSLRALAGAGAGACLTALAPGCTLPIRGPAVPRGQSAAATVLGLPNERFFVAQGTQGLAAEFALAASRIRQANGLAPEAPLPHLNLLAVSGGGENGAFGAGLLCGWSELGTRPDFTLVTGVSTGALTAPFAFLGPRYDAQLRSVYTELNSSDVLVQRSLLNAAFNDAMTDNTPLFDTISRFLTQQMLTDIAATYLTGRLLLVGTTDLDAQQPVIWNIGAIAASGHPKAYDTIRHVLLASAAIPGAFPPTFFDVTVNGQPHQEMHVDGGAFSQAFLYPVAATAARRDRMRSGDPVTPGTAYIIRNGRLDPEWAAVERRTFDIASRAISTMIAASGYNDVLRIYSTAKADGLGYRLAFIGADFAEELPRPFDQQFMRDLFAYGYGKGRAGYDWATSPPI